MSSFQSMVDIKKAHQLYCQSNNRANFFDPKAMTFFSSNLLSKVYRGRFFITSEQYKATAYAKQVGFKDGERKYTVRVCLPDGSISTVGEFQGYSSLQGAEEAIKLLHGDNYVSASLDGKV